MQRILSKNAEGAVQVECLTMDKVYSDRLNTEGERTKIEKLEMFDEWEEWNLLQGHYCLTLGTRSSSAHDINSIKI